MRSFNWTEIRGTCPEFIPNKWDVVLAIFATVGAILSCILMIKFKKTMKGSVFLNQLAGCDFGWCIMYLWTYFFTTAAVNYRSDFMAVIRILTLCEVKMVKDFYESLLTLLIFHIMLERFLWTCTSRTRQIWRLFTIGQYKFFLAALTTFYAVFSSFVVNWNHVQLSDVPFCDIVLLPVPIKQPVFRFIQIDLIPWVSGIATLLTFFLSLITLCRIPRVGEGEKPLNQEEINLSNLAGEVPRLTTGRIKRSIICMLAIYFTFMVRGFCYHLYVNPVTTNIHRETRNTRVLRSWSYDFMNVIFSGSRIIIYYVFCRNKMVVEFAPHGLGQ